MHKRIALVAALLAVVGVGCNTGAKAEPADGPGPEVKQAVLAANAGFYTALNEMFTGSGEAMGTPSYSMLRCWPLP